MKGRLVKLFKEHNIKDFTIEKLMEREVSLLYITFHECSEYLKVKYDLTGFYHFVRMNRNSTISTYLTNYYFDSYAIRVSDYEYYADLMREFFKNHFDILRYGCSGEVTVISPRHKIKLFHHNNLYNFMKE